MISFVLASVLVSAFVSAVWSRSMKKAGGGLERMELDLGLRLGQNGARSRPPSRPAVVLFFFFYFFAFGLWV